MPNLECFKLIDWLHKFRMLQRSGQHDGLSPRVDEPTFGRLGVSVDTMPQWSIVCTIRRRWGQGRRTIGGHPRASSPPPGSVASVVVSSFQWPRCVVTYSLAPCDAVAALTNPRLIIPALGRYFLRRTTTTTTHLRQFHRVNVARKSTCVPLRKQRAKPPRRAVSDDARRAHLAPPHAAFGVL